MCQPPSLPVQAKPAGKILLQKRQIPPKTGELPKIKAVRASSWWVVAQGHKLQPSPITGSSHCWGRGTRHLRSPLWGLPSPLPGGGQDIKISPPSLPGKPLNTALCVCVHVCVTPGMLNSKARHAQNNDVYFDTKALLILFAFCASRVFLLFSAFLRTQNMVWFLKDSRDYHLTLAECQA